MTSSSSSPSSSSSSKYQRVVLAPTDETIGYALDAAGEAALASEGIVPRLWGLAGLVDDPDSHFQKWHVTQKALTDFTHRIRQTYLPVPYHNWRHGVHVFLATEAILRKSTSKQCGLTALEVWTLLIAALCHDALHLGQTNAQLREHKSELVEKYHNESMLEKQSIDVGLKLLQETGVVGAAMPAEDAAVFQELFTKLILMTDLGSAFHKENIHPSVFAAGSYDPGNAAHRLAFMCLALCSADVGGVRANIETLWHRTVLLYIELGSPLTLEHFKPFYTGQVKFMESYALSVYKELDRLHLVASFDEEWIQAVQKNMELWNQKSVEDLFQKARQLYEQII